MLEDKLPEYKAMIKEKARRVIELKERYYIGSETALSAVNTEEQIKNWPGRLAELINKCYKMKKNQTVYPATPERVIGLNTVLIETFSEYSTANETKQAETYKYELEMRKDIGQAHYLLLGAAPDIFDIEISDDKEDRRILVKKLGRYFKAYNRQPPSNNDNQKFGEFMIEYIKEIKTSCVPLVLKAIKEHIEENDDTDEKLDEHDIRELTQLIETYQNEKIAILEKIDWNKAMSQINLNFCIDKEIAKVSGNCLLDELLMRIKNDNVDNRMEYRRMIINNVIGLLPKGHYSEHSQIMNDLKLTLTSEQNIERIRKERPQGEVLAEFIHIFKEAPPLVRELFGQLERREVITRIQQLMQAFGDERNYVNRFLKS